uniref:Uncharacterized protein n=1 Tax=Arundo donax TaxID=35708 RepID=A0A0A9BDG0_ARUDO
MKYDLGVPNPNHLSCMHWMMQKTGMMSII